MRAIQVYIVVGLVPFLPLAVTVMALVQRLRSLSALAAEAAPSTSRLWAVRTGEESPGIVDKHKVMGEPFDPPARLLMGPGPGNAHPRVLAAQSFPLLGHMHKPYFKIMDEVQEGLKCVPPNLPSFQFAAQTRSASPALLTKAHRKLKNYHPQQQLAP